jgi:hypothetical protein
MDYNRDALPGIEWCVGFQTGYWYSRGWFVEFTNTTATTTARLYQDSECPSYLSLWCIMSYFSELGG